MKTTPLNQAHREMKAKMVDFGGWDMPLHYGSQLDEHHKVRTDAGMFDVSHMLAVDIRGESTREFLRRLIANNVDKLTQSGKALYSCLLNPEGRIKVIRAFEHRLRTTVKHRELNRSVSYRRLIRLEGYKLVKHLLGDKKYVSFRLWW